MNKSPTNKEFTDLILAVKARVKPVPTDRAAFVVTALFLQRKEGIEPALTIKLRYRDFNLKDRWVEFTPFHRSHIVRRQLSDESAGHILSNIAATQAQPDDLLHQWTRVPHLSSSEYKHGRQIFYKHTWNDAVVGEVKRVKFNPRQFHPAVLRWAWLDEHPNIRENEVRADILAQFILDWAKPHQQEALFRILYKDSPVLRPSWAVAQEEPIAPPSGSTPESQNNKVQP